VGEGAAPSRHANLAFCGVYKAPLHGCCYFSVFPDDADILPMQSCELYREAGTRGPLIAAS
jgi:hypothetical protein